MTPRTTRIQHGVDLVHVPRLREVMDRHGDFAERIFTEAERAYCERFPDPLPHLAARFAAKEAALKALGLGITPLGVDGKLKEVEVVRRGSAPVLELHGKPAQEAERAGVHSTSLSFSHDGDAAIASVVMLAEPVA